MSSSVFKQLKVNITSIFCYFAYDQVKANLSYSIFRAKLLLFYIFFLSIVLLFKGKVRYVQFLQDLNRHNNF